MNQNCIKILKRRIQAKIVSMYSQGLKFRLLKFHETDIYRVNQDPLTDGTKTPGKLNHFM